MSTKLKLSTLLGLLFLGACTTMPSGPSVLVLPGTGKTFDQFRYDDANCRQFALSQINGTTTESAAVDSGVRSAALGTVLGAVAGAAVNGSRGAGVGAGAGLAMGGLAGAGAGQTSAYSAQQRLDMGYQQCMYAQGHRVPVSGRFASNQYMQQPSATYRATPPAAVVPPPPPGSPPPPPPGVQPR